jgi:hypothetical protein
MTRGPTVGLNPGTDPNPVMTKLTLGTILATVALFVWGAVFWMNPLPYTYLERTSDDAQAGQALLAHFPRTGTYILPGPHHEEATLKRLHEAGPLAMVHVVKQGRPLMAGSTFALGFLQELVVVMLIGALLHLARNSLTRYVARVRFVTVAGIAAAVFSDFGAPIWWNHPWPFHLVSAIYAVTGWFVVGLVLAAFIRPRPVAAVTMAG